MMENSTTNANNSKKQLESFVENSLLSLGYTEFQGEKVDASKDYEIIKDKQFIRQFKVGQTIYETSYIVDFFVVNRKKFPGNLAIECKWQQASGSVDEKYPYLVLNLVKADIPALILLDGKGYKAGAKKWLEETAESDNILLGVWDLARFKKEVKNGFLG